MSNKLIHHILASVNDVNILVKDLKIYVLNLIIKKRNFEYYKNIVATDLITQKLNFLKTCSVCY